MSRLGPLFCTLILILSGFLAGFGQGIYTISSDSVEHKIGKSLSYLEDPEGKFTFEEVVQGVYNDQFVESDLDVLFFGITRRVHWFRINLQLTEEQLLDENWLLVLKFEQHSYVDFYEIDNKKQLQHLRSGFHLPLNDRVIKTPDFAFPLQLKDLGPHEFLVRVESDRTKIVPFFVETEDLFRKGQSYDNMGYGIYFGIFLGLFIYNFFLFIGLRDRAYGFYIFSIFSTALLFLSTSGDLYEWVFYDHAYLGRLMIELASCLVSISTALFAKEFLKIKEYSKFLNYGLTACIGVAIIMIPTVFIGDLLFVQNILYNLLSIQILLLLASGIISWHNKNKYAGLYTIAWAGYLVGGLITMGRDLGLLSFNFFTSHAVEYGSTLEITLLALALSSRYNNFRKEKEQAIQRSLEIQKEATETLEQKVKERTAKLNETLEDLKDAQGQLVLAEKMASLGQLTAGVAHEINNPINFVSANIEPLKLNLEDLIHTLEKNPDLIDEDLKFTIDETQQLLRVMEDGTRRTADIVKGLRNFSRMDESDQKDMQVNECIETTLLMVHSLLAQNEISVEKDLGEIPVFEGNPGQLNQVFMNLFTNAIDAINENSELQIDEKKITISTRTEDGSVKISVEDTGKGIREEIKEKIFDPFFTTKDVGKGTGLGLSISYGIIERHQGNIEVENGKNGKGTVFTVTIPFSKAVQKD